MNIRKFIKNAFIILTALLLTVPVSRTYYVQAADGTTLSVQRLDLNINSIPSDRKVNLDISIENNPGIYVLYLLVQKNNSLGFSDSGQSFTFIRHTGITIHSYDNPDILSVTVPVGDTPVTDNGKIMTLSVTLPQDVHVNDFYEVSLLSDYDRYQSGICTPDCEDTYTQLNFNAGGIAITDGSSDSPATPADDQPAQQQIPSDQQPEQNIQPAINNNQSNESMETSQTSAETSAPKGNTSSPVNTSSSSDGISQGNVNFSKTSTAEKETAVTSPVSTGSSADKQAITASHDNTAVNNKKRSGILVIIAAASCAAIAAAVFIIRKKKK